MTNAADTSQSFALMREMRETIDIIARLNHHDYSPILSALRESRSACLTGEGSSRIFPAKHAVYLAQTGGFPHALYTQGSRQAAECDLSDSILIGASNSGKTKELIHLFSQRKAKAQFGLTAAPHSLLSEYCDDCFVLSCGKEEAVAATKSVIEQALFYHRLIRLGQKRAWDDACTKKLAALAGKALDLSIDPAWIEMLARAEILYFCGRNNGVAEEAALKANEITRKKSAYLEGTYAVHGIEEVMQPNEAVILIEPFEAEEEKFMDVLVKGVGLSVVAISRRSTIFPTIRIPELPEFDAYLQLMACWNLLVKTGLTLGIDLDKPVRARKVGNAFTPGA